jgi:hypothetical protein
MSQPAMANPDVKTSSAPESLSDHDRFLIGKVEEALVNGRQMEQWFRGRESEIGWFPLDLKKVYRLPNRAEGFFDSLEISGKKTTIMGCRQQIRLGRFNRGNASELLKEFVLGEFLSLAHWTYPDGWPGGFTVEQSLYKTADGQYGKFPAESQKGCIDWRQLGKEYAWVLLTIYIHDFVMDIGPIRKHLPEAAAVAPNTSFMHVVENPSPDYTLEVSIGYPFVEYAPVPNVFGFGPGKFGTAVKLFSFYLTPENEIQARLFFAASPRCPKVFDFGKNWPDPVYGGAELLKWMTLGIWDPAPFHDHMDTGMLAQHCRVHQALMDGVQKIWLDWAKAQSETISQGG